MRWLLCTALMLASGTAMADDYTHWVEPPSAPISTPGTVLEVEDYRCEATSARTISCMNIGRVCVEQRKIEDDRSAKMFGCAIKGSPNYPCSPGEPRQLTDEQIREFTMCTPITYGW
jgi:hypothetical protein